MMEAVRQIGTTLTPYRTFILPQPVTNNNLTAVLDDAGTPVARPTLPVDEVPVLPVRQTVVPVPAGTNSPVPAAAVVQTQTAQGLLAWAQANPLPAIAIVSVAAYVIYKLVKK